MVRVAAGIIKNARGEILICRRGAGGSCAHLWEFPGGKIEPGEQPRDCLARECKEELGVCVTVRELCDTVVYHYPERTVELLFFYADIVAGTPEKNVHEALLWAAPRTLAEFDFCPADADVVKKLAKGSETMVLVCYPGCSTCGKAERYLQSRGIAFAKREIKQDRPTASELAEWRRLSGLPLKRLFNTSGAVYRERRLKDRLPRLSEAEQLEELASDGMLVKRPLLVSDAFVLVGFKEAEWARRLEP